MSRRRKRGKRYRQPSQKRLGFDDWRADVQKCASELLGLGDVWDGDPYELYAGARAAFRALQLPEAFVREMFADDLASLEHDAEQFRESLEAAEGSGGGA